MRFPILICLFTSLFCIEVDAQNDVFPIENTTWSHEYYNPTGFPYRINHFVCGDTTYDQKVYKLIHNQPLQLIEGGVRIEGEQVYWHNFDPNEEERLLFDFEIVIGESFLFEDATSSIELEVDSIYNQEFEGVNRKVIRFGNGARKWIRGIGSNRHTFRYIPMFVGSSMLCVNQNGTTIYNGDDFACGQLMNNLGNCLISDTNETVKDASITLFPNPFSNEFQISIDGMSNVNNWQIQILNAYGKEIKTLSLSSQDQMIEMNDFPKGIYFLKMQNLYTHKSITYKIIKSSTP